jgi:hypothetical protein
MQFSTTHHQRGWKSGIICREAALDLSKDLWLKNVTFFVSFITLLFYFSLLLDFKDQSMYSNG